MLDAHHMNFGLILALKLDFETVLYIYKGSFFVDQFWGSRILEIYYVY